ncbi:MAG: M67 family metallopeptidase [Anaerolineae bacterium]|nr:M67 family metallopeptidase [Anaerolineae bacterium]
MKITDAQLKQIYTHAKETYPYECCGFLLGTFDDGGLVREVRPATNLNQERTDRFEFDGKESLQVQSEADDAGLDIIGIYHSHPDWPPIPSQTDMDSAFVNMYFLIVSVHQSMPLNTNIWRLADEGMRRFEGVALEIVDQAELNRDPS